jgi:hypothetical protein
VIQVVDETDVWQDLADRIKKKSEANMDEAVKDKDDEDDSPQQGQIDLSDDEDDEDVEKGRREVREFADPKLPTEREVQEHYTSGICLSRAGATTVSEGGDVN